MGQGRGAGGGQRWLQRLIAGALGMGISKRDLLEDYYVDEIAPVLEAWAALHGAGEGEEQVDGMTFLGGGGEVMGQADTAREGR